MHSRHSRPMHSARAAWEPCAAWEPWSGARPPRGRAATRARPPRGRARGPAVDGPGPLFDARLRTRRRREWRRGGGARLLAAGDAEQRRARRGGAEARRGAISPISPAYLPHTSRISPLQKRDEARRRTADRTADPAEHTRPHPSLAERERESPGSSATHARTPRLGQPCISPISPLYLPYTSFASDSP